MAVQPSYAPLASQMRALSLESDSCSNLRPKPFSDPRKPVAEKSDPFLAALKTAKLELREAAKKQLSITLRIFSRLAPSCNVEETHDKWQEELKAISTQIRTVSTQQTDFARRVIALTPTEQVRKKADKKMSAFVKAARKVQCLDQRLEFISEENRKLSLLLASSRYPLALQLLKQMTLACEKICTGGGLPKCQLQELASLFVQTVKTIEEQRNSLRGTAFDPHIYLEIKKLHLELLEFFNNSLALMEQKTPALKDGLEFITLARHVQESVKSCDESELYRYKEHVSQTYSEKFVTLNEGELRIFHEKITAYQQTFKKVDLKKELTFQMATWMKKFFTRRITPDRILSIVDTLAENAKGLQKIHKDIKQRLEDICSAKLQPREGCRDHDLERRFYEAPLLQILRNIQGAQNQLRALALTDEVHADLNYAEGLLVYRKEVMRKLDFFSKITQGRYIDALVAEEKVFHFLTHLCTANPYLLADQIEAVQRLFSAAGATRALAPVKAQHYVAQFRGRIIQTMEDILPIVNQKTLLDATWMDRMWIQIVTETPLDMFSCEPKSRTKLPDNIKVFIEQLLLQWLFFHDEQPQAKQEIMLYVLKTSPQYKNAFNESFATDLRFKEMIAFYERARGKQALDEALLAPLSMAFGLLHSTKASGTLSVADCFRYGQSIELLARCDQYIANHPQIIQEANKLLLEVKQNTGFPVSYSKAAYFLNKDSLPIMAKQPLYGIHLKAYQSLTLTLLVKALWGPETEKAEAKTLLHNHFQTLDPSSFQTAVCLQQLMYELAIQLYLEPNNKLHPFEKAMIYLAMLAYLQNQEWPAQLRLLHPLPSLETILYMQVLEQGDVGGLAVQIKMRRGSNGYDCWKQAMQTYLEWKQTPTDERERIKRDTLMSLTAGSIFMNLENPYQDIITACFDEVNAS